MSRLHYPENGPPQHRSLDASNGTGSTSLLPLISGSGDNVMKIMPVPPKWKSNKPYSKRNTQLHNSRFHLEPLTPPFERPTIDTHTLTVSAMSGEVSWDSTVMEAGSTIMENLDKFLNVDRKLQFYKTLTALSMRDAAQSEQSLQNSLTSLLCATATALDATTVVLYSLSSAIVPVVKVVACSSFGPGIVGFQTPLATFALRELVEQFEVNNDEASRCRTEPAATYVACLQNLGTYDITCDVDSVLGLTTSSVLAGVLPDECGRPRFVMEARSIHEGLTFSNELMHAALIAVENLVYPFELRRALARQSCTHSVVLEMLWHTIDSPDQTLVATQDGARNENIGPITGEAEPFTSPGAKWDPSRQIKLLGAQIMTAVPRLLGLGLVELLSDKFECKFHATHGMGFELNQRQRLCAVIESSKDLYQNVVESVRTHTSLDLSDNVDLNVALQSETSGKHSLIFLPVPTCRQAATPCGLFCLVSNSIESLCACNESASTLEKQLQPIVAAISSTLSAKQQSNDLIASTRQTRQLMALCRSHLLVDSVRDPSSLVSLICDLGSVVFQTAHVTLYVSDTVKQELWSLGSRSSINGLRIPYGRGIAGHVAVTKEPLTSHRPYEDSRFDQSVDAKFGFKTESLITQPILDHAGETVGVLQAVNFKPPPVVSPVVASYDDEVMANYLRLVAHALHMNSSLIIFAKVKADYWATRTGQDVLHDEGVRSANIEGNDNNDSAGTENLENDVDGKHEVASVHSLLDSSGFDEARAIIAQNKWSTFAYTCWALGRFISLKRRATVRCEQYERGMVDDSSFFRKGSHQTVRRPRMRSHRASVARTHSLITRWHRMTMGQEGFGDVNELLHDHFDPLTKSIPELENYAYQLFEGLVLIRTFRIEGVTLRMFIGELAGKYRDVPYHSFYHGFDVALASYALMRSPEVLSVIKELEALSLLIAALGHDADHPGNDNQFEVDASTALALCYNDISVLENHHAATTFAVLRRCDILHNLSANARASARTMIVRSILGTDMKHHTKLLSELAGVTSVHEFNHVPEGRQLMLTMIIHGADLSSVGRPLPVALKWVERVCTEFTQQATRSAEAGLNVPSHLLNLQDEVTRCRLQMNFIDYLVAPLWVSISGLIPAAKDTLDHLRSNRLYFSEQVGAKHSG